MSDEDILSLPVSEICCDNAALFLWVTYPNLPLGLKVIEAWGFRYATQAFTWVKKTKHGKWFWGCGNYTRANAEVCLLGVRGTMKRRSASVLSVLDSPIGRHSAKPAEVRDKIVLLFGDIPRIELFAREQIRGWWSWGNEVNPVQEINTTECGLLEEGIESNH
jgi:site-specific DNA-methyltransferase (adenine-specific)